MPAQQYRRRPIIVEAIPVRDALHAAARDWPALPAWLADAYEHGAVVFARDAVHLYRGTAVAGLDDWLVRDHGGKIAVVGPEAFELTFESIDQERG